MSTTEPVAHVGQVWALRGYPQTTRTVTAVHGGYVDTDRGRCSVGNLLRNWRPTDVEELEAAGLPTAGDTLNCDAGEEAWDDTQAARDLLAKLGFEVTDSLERDVDRAIDVERQRREHDRTLIALVLGHSRDAAIHLRRDELLETVRDAALDRDRCDSCPWVGHGWASVECGGAAGICPGNVRPTVAEVLERHPEPGS